MTYSVKNSAQTTTYTVNDNTENSTSTSLVFIGKNYTGYGLALNENFLYLLENFSNTVGNYPLNPVPGQLFWDNTNKYMHVYDGTAWKVIYGALASLTVNSAVSFNGITTSNGGQVSGYLTGAIGANVANSGVFTTVTTNNGGQHIGYHTGAIGANSANSGIFTTITTTNGGQVSGYHTGAIGANLANSGVFTTVAASTVNANVLGNTGSSIYGVIATNAQPFITSIGTLTGLTSSANITAQTANVYAAYVVANTGLYGPIATNAQPFITSVGTLSSLTITGAVQSNTHTGVAVYAGTIGNSGAVITGATLTLSSYAQATNFYDATGNYNVNLGSGGTAGRGVVAGYSNGSYGSIGYNLTHTSTTNTYNKPQNDQTTMLRFDSGGMNLYSNSSTTAQSSITLSQILGINNAGVTTHYGAVVPSANNSITLGSASAYWSTVYGVNFVGTSTTATYADLAEKYLPDADYEIGTVMMVGGSAEVTNHNGDRVRAIGVTSEYPAYKMNSDLDGGVYVALKGRVPVRVVGPVKKGQSLFGSAHGLAMATDDTTPTSFAIALESFDGNGIGSIEAVIL